MNQKEWNKAVKEAKQVAKLLRLTNAHRIKIAEIAMRVCDIEHGGKPTSFRYTIRKFGEEIEINGQTISEWIRYKKYIYDKLTAEQQETYKEISSNLLRPIIKGLTKDTRPKTVQRKFNSFAKSGFVESKFKKYCMVFNTVIYHLSEFRRIAEIPDDTLKEIRIKSRRCLRLVDKELKSREMGPPRLITPKPVMTAAEIWDEVLP